MEFTVCAAALALSVAADASAQKTPTQTNAKVTDATVYFRGAELTHTVSVPVTRGVNEIIIEGLSPVIDVQTLRVKATGGVVISSSEFGIDYTAESKSSKPQLEKLEADYEKVQLDISQTNIDLRINNEMLQYLRTGIQKNVSGSEAGMGVDELKKTIDYYKQQATELEAKNAGLNKRLKELNETMSKLSAQIQQERMKGNKTSGVLRLNFSSPTNGNSQFTIIYFTTAAGWQPFYDINIAAVDKPVSISTRAKVSQTTGLDWDKVNLSLSTAVPSNGKIAPLFTTWFLEQAYSRSYDKIMQNRYDYDSEYVVMEESVMDVSYVKSRSSEPAQISKLYIVDGATMSESDFNSIDQQYIKSMEVINDSATKRSYGNPETLIKVTLKEMQDFVANVENEINTVYAIDIPYSIPGNGKDQTIDIKRQETSAKFSHYSAPKLDGAVYLLAKISGWESLGLMNGNANITYDGTFIGTTFIDASSTQSDLTLTLGTDPRVSVKREKMQDYSTTKSFGSNTQQTFAYKITVRNNRNNAIDMVVKDQYPVSTSKEIEVTLNTKETTKWTANVEGLGVISWEERLEPGETKEYIISYTVKYPKNMTLNL